MMHTDIQMAIIKILIEACEPISAEKIAEKLHISRRTVFNNMDKVKEICKQYHADLISIRSKGYKIENFNELYLLDNKVNHQFQAGYEESKLYIIYLLLEDDTPIHISEIQDILYCSRPTVYKYLGNIKEWFEKFDIEVIISRQGIYLNTGEKRYRHALNNWMLETHDLLKKKEKLYDGSDVFKLKYSLNAFMPEDLAVVSKCVESICDALKIHISLQEMKSISYLLEVIILRIKMQKNVQISNRLIHLTKSYFSEEIIQKVKLILDQTLNQQMEECEIVYLIVSIIQIGNFSDVGILAESTQNFMIHQALLNNIEEYLKAHMSLTNSSFAELMEDIKIIIKRETLFQIKGENSANARYYDSILKNFHATVVMAQELFDLIIEYYDIYYYEKVICNIAFSLLSVIQKNKQNLRAVLIHNCDVFEFKYVLSSLQCFPFISLVFSTDNELSLEKYVLDNQTDVIFSTIHYEHSTIPIIEITKVFGSIESIEIIKRINQLHQTQNYYRILHTKKINE